jgi:hypothetical protein
MATLVEVAMRGATPGAPRQDVTIVTARNGKQAVARVADVKRIEQRDVSRRTQQQWDDERYLRQFQRRDDE